ncbi:LysR family transcriptional regulator [Novosphingobium sp.]|uniref:LysR family transcriptional regulator n=1 Tax=Novosphingobium sp. TaxID=1874826 RepID=UPI002FDD49B9
MDRLEAMALLVETVDAGSMSAAGRKRGMPLPTISRKLADLEAHLGVRLLNRSTRRLELTAAGAAYLVSARAILEQVGEAEREATGEYRTPRGALVVTAPTSFGRRHVLPLVGEFLARHDAISARLILTDQQLDLVGERIDLAVRIGVLADSQLIARRVGPMRWVVVGSPGLIMTTGVPRAPADLAAMPCIGIDTNEPGTLWHFNGAAVRIGPRLLVNSGEGAVDAAADGVGFARVMLYHAAPALAAGRLQVLLPDYEPDPLPLSIVYTGAGPMPLKTRSFLDFVMPRLQQDLARINATALTATLPLD